MKILLQKIYTAGLDWDETLLEEMRKEWGRWRSELKLLQNFYISRKYFPRALKGLHFPDLDFGEKRPWLLLNKDRYSELVILHAHNCLLHAGVEATLAQVREKFWILKGRQCVKSILSRCFLLKKYTVGPVNQEITPLPPDRVLESPPFSISGLDFAGLFSIKDSDKKHYLLLFSCATTRALHLELLPSMSTDQFLLAFHRFIS
ncbi:integrase catalytic domain-containing protein [Trichonephila inaurata madagascariensis]|uniref:Integrase catalytic domain-containing protein n=1 Tax=Trichonephila inaurata madagascariensis TaxID=2747483 RepID=A0A8X7C7F9_9ARAC|nr:integrase catalytic domain-containing protein [Trichonephila inaurata madagascariensis]